MATFKTVEYLGNAEGTDTEFTLTITGASSGDTVLLAIVISTNALGTGTLAVPAGWVNAIDPDTPLAKVDSSGFSIIPYVYDGVPPSADVTLTTLAVRYFIAVVLTLAEGEALSDFQMEYSDPTTPGEDVALSFAAPGDGTLGLLAISEWLGDF